MSVLESRDDREQISEELLRDDTKRALSKIAFIQYAAVGAFIFLIAGFWQLQVQNPAVYSEAAERNKIRSTPILAPRGKILDRDGRVIVDNKASYSLIISRDFLKPEHLPFIAQGVHLDYDELVDKLRRASTRPQVVVKEELTKDEISFVEAHRDPQTYPEMELIQAQKRLYPQDGFAAHLLGYVGEISEAELNTPELIQYHPGDVIGKDGLEKQYNQMLMGVDGQRRVWVDNFGRERRVDDPKPVVPGKDLQTTIDLDLQAVAELTMEGKRGAVVALDPRNGAVLAMVSRPTYDPNKFTGRISRKDWNEIMGDPYKPLFNRSVQAELAPGSTFKPLVALAGLETGVIDGSTTFRCPGGASFYGHYFSCHKKSGHGSVDVHRGIVQSCDVFFYNTGNKLGIDRLAQYADMAGVGNKSGIDLPRESVGTMPSTKWKLRTARQKYYAGETISVAIGQGAVTVSPLQLAYAIGGLAVGGKWYRPHLRSDTTPVLVKEGHFNQENVQQVIAGMYGVVNEWGTGAIAKLPNIAVCGKTGTAQLASNQFLKGTKLGRTMKDNAWFVAFAPREAPEIVVVALFEGGEHGPNAAPISRDVIKAYFDKKERDGKQRRMIAQAPRFGVEAPALVFPNLAPGAGRPQ